VPAQRRRDFLVGEDRLEAPAAEALLGRERVRGTEQHAVDGRAAERRAGGQRGHELRVERGPQSPLVERLGEDERDVRRLVVLPQVREPGAAGAGPEPALDALAARDDGRRAEAPEDREAAE
jgi:hypothetical protein